MIPPRLPLPLTRPFTTSPHSHKSPLFDISVTPYSPSPSQSPPKHLRLVIFGKPGSGKGTLSTRLTSLFPLQFLSTGDSLRRHISLRTPLGIHAEALVASGQFLPDRTMLQVVLSELDTLPSPNWVLDGFPRTVEQAKMLDRHLLHTRQPLTLVVHLDVPDETILSRIRDRWVHAPSGRVYNLGYNPPRVPGKDDHTGEGLQKRADDDPAVFGRRLQVYERETRPVLDYYLRAEGAEAGTRVVSLTGETSDEIWPGLEREVRALGWGEEREPPTATTTTTVATAKGTARQRVEEVWKAKDTKEDERRPAHDA
ncbi:P-loop containing nucleoside triphosphate hydrolase protein [Dacryopinax primogenitus]|uniref:p-loop containing nucleoside triphosphate hydrolase protein n=1 Tax=Dacryopinax primogenitus (strain DJM 731) TaxID=1858805 RepID=M5G9U9_DACPD|nr:P-loop containing nucleoside triphosphate hydrolase protein [Dacryopinax primogenitus]EJU05589.1 P-loop containing nucleoside triphosphate hydrolase protein [Dacryopinax primogenitus]